MKLVNYFIILLICSAHLALAQSNPGALEHSSYEVQMVPPNPDVANLGKFGDIPINKYNGTANISVPIYAIELDGLQIPIQLTYNTGGIRVNQDASWVGLGWNLSDGIVITREVNGYEDIYDGNEHTGWLYSADMLHPTGPQDDQFELDAEELFALYQEYPQPSDLEPDIFSVSLPNGSFKFYLPKIVDQNAAELEAQILGEQNFLVSYVIGNKTFRVTDPNGFIYYFDKKELSTSYASQNDSGTSDDTGALANVGNTVEKHRLDMISSWKVSEIRSPHYDAVNNNQARLSFTYTDGFHVSFPNFTETFTLNSSAQYNNPHQITLPTNTMATLTTFKYAYLTEVTGNFGTIRFQLGDRKDLFTETAMEILSGGAWNILPVDNQKKLDAIYVEDYNTKVVETTTFHYSYFNEDEQPTDENGVRRYIRLKLDKLKVQDKEYHFEYICPNELPAKDTKSVDFWGFYNGVNNNLRIPSFNRFIVKDNSTTHLDEFFVRFRGANKKSDFSYGRVGLLSKVVYPTGGSTVFEYEPNSVVLKRNTYTPEYHANNNFKSSGLMHSEAYNFRYQMLKLAEDPNYSLEDQAFIACDISQATIPGPGTEFNITETEFCDSNLQMSSGGYYNIEVTTTIACGTGCADAPYPQGVASWIKNLDTEELIDVTRFTEYQYNPNLGSRQYVAQISLPVGRYALISAGSWVEGSAVYTTSVSAVTFHDNSSSPPQDVYEEFEVGGARIRKIVNKDINGDVLGIKEFSYNHTIGDGTLKSSGKLMDDLVYCSTSSNMFEYAPDVLDNYNISSYNKLRTQNSASGSHVGYSQVTERTLDSNNNDNGHIISKYYNQANQYLKRNVGISQYNFQAVSCSGYSSGNPYLDIDNLDCYNHVDVVYGDVYILGAIPYTHSHINGSLEEEHYYPKDSNQPVRSVFNTYKEYDAASGPHVFTYYPIMFKFNHFLLQQPYQKISPNDFNHRKIVRMEQTKDTTYYGAYALATLSDYTYNLQSGYQLNQVVTANSNGEVNTSRAYYPNEVDTEPFMADLITQNRLTNKVRTEAYLGTSLNPEQTILSSQETTFGNQAAISGLVLPSEVITLKGT